MRWARAARVASYGINYLQFLRHVRSISLVYRSATHALCTLCAAANSIGSSFFCCLFLYSLLKSIGSICRRGKSNFRAETTVISSDSIPLSFRYLVSFLLYTFGYLSFFGFTFLFSLILYPFSHLPLECSVILLSAKIVTLRYPTFEIVASR